MTTRRWWTKIVSHPLGLLRVLAVLSVVAAAAAAETQSSSSSTSGREGSDLTHEIINRHPSNRSWFLPNAFTFHITRRAVSLWDIVTLLVACGLLQAFFRVRTNSNMDTDVDQTLATHGADEQADPGIKSDPGLLKKHSVMESYITSVAVYPRVRTFYHPHPHANKLPKRPKPLPLLVFIHGLGGSLLQFNSLLNSMVNIAPCFGIDLPGCGLSLFSPRTWEAYSHSALSELVTVAISRACSASSTCEVVLMGHSMGCSIAASICSKRSHLAEGFKFRVIGMIAICPKASLPAAHEVKIYRRLLMIPTPLFNLWRLWDRRGGVESTSVARFVGDDAPLETKALQLKFNEQSRTGVWRRMAWGALSSNHSKKPHGGLPGPTIWAGIPGPLFLVAGEADHITRTEEVSIICEALGKIGIGRSSDKDVVMQSTVSMDARINTGEYSESDDALKRVSTYLDTKSAIIADQDNTVSRNKIAPALSATEPVVKTSILPNPASHGLFYDSRTYRTLSGLMQTFLSDHVDYRLALGWQLQQLKDANKWDVKNLAKWQAVKPVSEPIAGIFRAMKTLREVDESHSPKTFVSEWRGKVKAVIDISHESPVYNPQGLEHGGIAYHKFPTVSKIPPTAEEVRDFVKLVDNLRTSPSENDTRLVGVHCHYGFNRTGFFVCSYLIENEQYSVQGAIDEFHQRRPPGIRHEHFIDTLFVRYCIGLKRAPTL